LGDQLRGCGTGRDQRIGPRALGQQPAIAFSLDRAELRVPVTSWRQQIEQPSSAPV
jgi:hypothetical protein